MFFFHNLHMGIIIIITDNIYKRLYAVGLVLYPATTRGIDQLICIPVSIN